MIIRMVAVSMIIIIAYIAVVIKNINDYDIDKKAEKVVRGLLDERYGKDSYGFCEDKDGRYCINKQNSIWITYYYKNNRRENRRSHINIIGACTNLILHMNDTEDRLNEAVNIFNARII